MNDANQRLSRKLLAEIRLLVIHNKPAIPAMLNKRQVVTIYHACPNDQNVSDFSRKIVAWNNARSRQDSRHREDPFA